jgi:hypothetical protein
MHCPIQNFLGFFGGVTHRHVASGLPKIQMAIIAIKARIPAQQEKNSTGKSLAIPRLNIAFKKLITVTPDTII